LQENLPDAQANLLGWCLIKPRTSDRGAGTDSLAVLLRRVLGGYAQYYNTRSGRTGHVSEGCRQKTAQFRLTHFVHILFTTHFVRQRKTRASR
jgi:hypothetical protein